MLELGPIVVSHLRRVFPRSELIGFDSEQGLAQMRHDDDVPALRDGLRDVGPVTAGSRAERLRRLRACCRGDQVLSDGTPWRPLIDVRDMARAIEWAVTRKEAQGGPMLIVNVGSDERNHQVRELAEAVAVALPGTTVSINQAAPPDGRSYRVDFSKSRRLAPAQPRQTLQDTIAGLVEGLRAMGFADADFRRSTKVIGSMRCHR